MKLFDRSTRSVTLTQAGEDLLPVVDNVLGDLSSVVERARDVARRNTGRVTVAALPSLSATLMPLVVAQMRDEASRHRHRDQGCAGRAHARAHSRRRSRPRGHECAAARSAAFVHAAPYRPHGCGIAATVTRSPTAKTVRLADLLDSPLVLMDRDSSVRRIVDGACASIGRLASPVYEAAYMATAIGLVRAGLGATLLPSSASELLAAGDLVIRDLDAPRVERPSASSSSVGVRTRRQRKRLSKCSRRWRATRRGRESALRLVDQLVGA